MPNQPITQMWRLLTLSVIFLSGTLMMNAQSSDCDVTSLALYGDFDVVDFNQNVEVGVALFSPSGNANKMGTIRIEDPDDQTIWFANKPLNDQGDYFETINLSLSKEGYHSITYTSESGCVKQSFFNLCVQPRFTIIENPISCNGSADGGFSIVPGKGEQLSYQWSNGETGETITGLGQGSISVRITDASGCSKEEALFLPQPDPLDIDVKLGVYNCAGQLDSMVVVDITGGSPPYDVDWSYDGMGDYDDEMELHDMPEGGFQLAVRDQRGCEKIVDVIIDYGSHYDVISKTVQLIPVINDMGTFIFDLRYSTNMKQGDVDNDGQNGSVHIVTYHADSMSAVNQTNPLGPMYPTTQNEIIYARTESYYGCVAISRVELGINDYCLFNSEACSNGAPVLLEPVECTLAATPLPAGGVYTCYLINGMSRIQVDTLITCDAMTGECYLDPTDAEGSYEIDYTYDDGMGLVTKTALFDIQDLNPQILGETDSICGNIPQVGIRVNPIGGVFAGPGYSDGSLIVGTNQFFIINPPLLVPEVWYTYTYTYSQTNGSGLICTKTAVDSFYIKPYPNVNVTGASSELCASQALTLGSITTSPDVVLYEWRDPDGIVISNDTNLIYPNTQKTGTYSIKVTNSIGCVDSSSVNIDVLELPQLNCSINARTSCPGGEDAVARVDILNPGNIMDYTFVWSNGFSGQEQSGLSAGDYVVVVTDDRGCADSCDVTVSQPPVFDITCDHVIEEVGCFGEATGVDSVAVSGGTPPYEYSKDNVNFQVSPILTGLSGGLQHIYIRDANGCIDSCEFHMPEPPAMTCSPAVSNPVSCFSGNDGAASINPSGGTPPYSVLWSTGSNLNSISGLVAGEYWVELMDANGCICRDTVEVTQPLEPLALNCSFDSLDCFGDTNGNIAVTASGGTPPYKYRWNTNDSTNALIALSAGVYVVEVTDNNGCSTICTTYVYQPEPIELSCIDDQLLCPGDVNGQVTAAASGGTLPYNYEWSDGQNTVTAAGLSAGNYSVTLTDNNGCVDSCEATVAEPLEIDLNVEEDSVCLDFKQTITAKVNGGTPPYSYQWYLVDADTTGAIDTNLTNVNDPEVIFNSFCLLPGTILLGVDVTDDNGCVKQATVPFHIQCCFDLAIMKTVDRAIDYQPGDTVSFDINVFNQGFVDAYTLTIKDSMESVFIFEPSLNTKDKTGNPADWVLGQSGNAYTDFPFLAEGESQYLKINLIIVDTFSGYEITNYTEIDFFSNGLKDMPIDEDDPIARINPMETDNDIDDDRNGRRDNPFDDDQKDFAKVFLCSEEILACNDLVQLSLDKFGQAIVTPDIVLEARQNYALLSLKVTNSKGEDVGTILDCSHIGDTLTVMAQNGCDKSSCWGKLIVEDKLPPEVICAEPDTFYCFETPVNLKQDVVSDNCTPTERVIVSDVMEKFDCDSNLTGKRTITSYHIDAYGNRSELCEKEIFFLRYQSSMVQFPKDTIFSCDDFPGAKPQYTGQPTIDGKPIYPNNFNCSVALHYKDDTIQICGAGYKLIRTWTALDWCPTPGFPNPITAIQLIKVVDDAAPVIYCPGTDDQVDTVGTDPWTCTATILLPEPHVLVPGQPIVDSNAIYILSECSDFTYSVEHLAADSPENCTPSNALPSMDQLRLRPDGRWEAYDIQQGCNWFYYTIIDECGNETTCTFDIYVEDRTPPVAVCDAHTVVALNLSGKAVLEAQSVDDGSLDNCELGDMKVRRMDGIPCGGSPDYNDHVVFCCDDVGKTIMVEFVVWDTHSNSNTCMVEVQVQNKIAPVLVSCPKDVTINCTDDYEDLKITGGPAVFEGVCDLLVDFDDNINLNSCGLGEVYRHWTARDEVGNTVGSCTQTITIQDPDPLNAGNIIWPKSYIELVNVKDCDGDPDPDISGRPEMPNRGCFDALSTYEDLELIRESGSCFKILREWTVVDWCTYNVVTGAGKWSFEQTIVVKNDIAPLISCSDTTYCGTNKGCGKTITFKGQAQDDCTPSEDLIWRIEVDELADGDIDYTSTDRSFDQFILYGRHRVDYYVKDGCGNETMCSEFIEVIDCKPPTPICKSGLITVIMPSTGEVTIWASDFDEKSDDNCTNAADLEFSFSDDVNDKSRTYTCDDLELQDTFHIEIWVTDEFGNQDFCKTIIIVQDNQSNCETGNVTTVTGSIMTADGSGIRATTIMVDDDVRAVTNESGGYNLEVELPSTVLIKAEKDDDFLNGISTRDIVYLQQYLLGGRNLEMPFDYIAADVDNNEHISVADIVALRRLILGATPDLPNDQKSWRFLSQDYQPQNAEDMYPLSEAFDLYIEEKTDYEANFTGVKIGDLDGSVETQLSGRLETRSSEALTIVVRYTNGEIQFVSDSDEELYGLQLSLLVDDDAQINPGLLNLGAGNYSLIEGELRLSWHSADGGLAIQKGDVLFSIANINEVATNDGLEPEWYGLDDIYGPISIKLEEENGNSTDKDLVRLFQNIPNPFNNSTVIPFELQEGGDIRLSIFGSRGELIHEIEGYYSSGRHEVLITSAVLDRKGLMYYRLENDDSVQVRKMVRQ